LRIGIVGVLIGIIILLLSLPNKCQQPTLKVTDTIKLRYDFTDTITRIRYKYRNLVDSHTRWVYDSTWSNLCRSYTDSLSGESCQREVVRMLNEGQLKARLVDAYNTKWQKDSVWIQQAIELDSIKSERIVNLVDKLATKPKKKGKIAHIVSALFMTYLVLKI
jgi:hypothetical protein